VVVFEGKILSELSSSY